MQQTSLLLLPGRRLQEGFQEEAAPPKARGDTRDRPESYGVLAEGEREKDGKAAVPGGCGDAFGVPL